MGQTQQHDQIRSGRRLQVYTTAVLGEPDRLGAPRVHDDQSATGAGPRQVAEQWGHGRGDVGAQEKDRVRLVQIGDRKRKAAIDAECAVSRCGRARHAEPTVVVDATRAERDPGELSELIRLLVREAAAAEDGHRVGTAFEAKRQKAPGDVIQRLVPRDFLEPVRAASERCRHALRMPEQFRRGPAFLAEASAVGREVPGGDRGAAVRGRQRHRALQGAVGAVRRRLRCGCHRRVPVRRPPRTYTRPVTAIMSRYTTTNQPRPAAYPPVVAFDRPRA